MIDFRFKSSVLATAAGVLTTFAYRTTVGVYVRQGDIAAVGHSYFIRLPPITYFSNVMAYFCSKYAHMQFVVVSEDPT